MYYLVYEGNGNSNTNMIYKFDAKTGTSIQLTQAIPNTYYSKMQVSKDGNWIFAQAYRWTGNNSSDTRYLRAIPTSDPENSIPLFYSSTGNSWINDWCYDDDSKTMYYIQDSNMYAIPLKDGTFDKQNRVALFSSNNSSSLWFNYESLFKWDNNSVVTWTGCCSACDIDDEYGNNKYYYFRNPDSEKREIQPEQILKYLFAKAFDSFDYSITWSDWKKDYDDGKYEIRFDKFAEVEGYEALATLTKGKTDLSLIQTIIDDGLEELLYTLLNDNYDSGSDWYRCDQYFNNFYKHNFFADILYEKSTGKPISTDLFRKQTYGNSTLFYSNGIYIWNVLKSSYNNGYVWKDDFKKDKKVDAEKVLKELARYCGKSEIDFSLKCFKDDKTYGILYTDLTNKEAIEFLDTPARLSKLSTYFNDNWDSYNGAGKFLLETCFVKDTNFETPAYKWNKSSNDTIWWGCVSQLTPSYGESLYGVYSNGDGFGLIRIVDADGNKDGGYVASFSDYKVSDLISSTNGFYFKNSLLDENEEETGNHQIQYYDVIKDECTNLFENVTDNTELEVISFTAGDNCIYYCAAKGFSIINGKIDIGTKAATVLSTNTKLTQIIVIK